MLQRDMPVMVLPPTGPALPLVCDSPHSGTAYPDDFGYAVNLVDLRRLEDTHVHWLWDAVPRVGGTLIHATFPRSYIDPNRNVHDVDNSMLAEPWTGPVSADARSLALGNGLVSSLTPTRQPIYSRQLSVTELTDRIEHYWRPYRRALTGVLESALALCGRRWHLNLHSMPSNAYERLGRVAPGPLADVVLGNLYGRSCSSEFTMTVAEAFRQLGYTVAINDPYAGRDLLLETGAPDKGCDSLQIELNRAIYLNEHSRELLSCANAVRKDIGVVSQVLADYIRRLTAVPV